MGRGRACSSVVLTLLLAHHDCKGIHKLGTKVEVSDCCSDGMQGKLTQEAG
jgi:hypothetical protein